MKEIIEKLDKEFMSEIACSACSGYGVIQNPLWKGITAKMSDKEIRNYFAERGYYDTLPREEEICQRCDGKGKRVRSIDEQIEYLHNRDRELLKAVREKAYLQRTDVYFKNTNRVDEKKVGINNGVEAVITILNALINEGKEGG